VGSVVVVLSLVTFRLLQKRLAATDG
jgi:hypothetical protein